MNSFTLQKLPPSDPRTGKLSKLMLIILLLVLLCSVILFLSHIWNILAVQNFTDFGIYFQAAEAAHNNMPIYNMADLRTRTFVQYKYPPLNAHFLKFFVPWGSKNVALIWFFLSICFYLASLVIWIRTVQIRFVSSMTFLLASMLFSSLPAIISLSGGQPDCLMLLLLMICCWGIYNNRPVLSGGSIAILTMIKVFPIILLLPFVQARKFRYLKAFCLIFGLMLLLSVALAGLQEHKEFLFEVLPANSVGSAYVENQSLFGFLARFYIDGSDLNDGRPANLPLILWITSIIGICMLAATLYLARSNRTEFSVAALLVWLLIALPVAWIHYQTLLFFPAVLYLNHQLKNRVNDNVGWFLFALAWACIAFGDHSFLKNAPILLQSYKFYGVLILWTIYIRAMWKKEVVNEYPQ